MSIEYLCLFLDFMSDLNYAVYKLFKFMIEKIKCFWKAWYTPHRKWSFALRVSSVNMTKSAGKCGFCYIYWKNLFFCAVIYTIRVAICFCFPEYYAKCIIPLHWRQLNEPTQLLDNIWYWKPLFYSIILDLLINYNNEINFQ